MSLNEVINFYILRFFNINKISTPCLQLPYYRKGFKVITPSLIKYAHACNKKVHAWTIDDPVQINELLDMGIDGIMTDSPELLKSEIAKRGINI
jgi:glycerophosphoryl diester phosphodiesterase